MIEDEINKFHTQSSIRKNAFDFSTMPRELAKEIFFSFRPAAKVEFEDEGKKTSAMKGSNFLN